MSKKPPATVIVALSQTGSKLVVRATKWLLAALLSSDAFAAGGNASMPTPLATYTNPIIAADFSDPDVIATPSGFWMTASSFNSSPALPLLFSDDLVRWKLVRHALVRNQPEAWFSTPQHGNGVWAPCLRFHNGRYWIFYPDPDHGIWVTSTEDPVGTWSTPRLILAGKGLIDPTPLWDKDGRAWLLHGWAKSRAGFNNQLTLHEMAPDVSWVKTEGSTLIDGNQLPAVRTLEGPKFYFRDDYYWIFAPQGGVTAGTQLVFRAKTLDGPWQHRTVLAQGNTDINGPHQGAWVRTPYGEDWFIHFQSRPPFGRIVHLQPMSWRDDHWPVLGSDDDGDGIGEPVYQWARPRAESTNSDGTQLADFTASDEFQSATWHPAWHWNSNSETAWADRRSGQLILNSQPAVANLWQQPAVLLQRLPAESIVVETEFSGPLSTPSWRGGLVVYGEDYAWIGLQSDEDGNTYIGIGRCRDARSSNDEVFEPLFPIKESRARVRATVSRHGHLVFSVLDTAGWRTVGELMQARQGRWVGAKVGLFAEHRAGEQSTPLAVEYFRMRPTNAPTLESR